MPTLSIDSVPTRPLALGAPSKGGKWGLNKADAQDAHVGCHGQAAKQDDERRAAKVQAQRQRRRVDIAMPEYANKSTQ